MHFNEFFSAEFCLLRNLIEQQSHHSDHKINSCNLVVVALFIYVIFFFTSFRCSHIFHVLLVHVSFILYQWPIYVSTEVKKRQKKTFFFRFVNITIAIYGAVSEILDHGLGFTFKELGLLVDASYCSALLFVFCDCSHKSTLSV